MPLIRIPRPARRHRQPDSGRFRVTRINLDTDLDVRSVTVITQPGTAAMIRGMLGGPLKVTSLGSSGAVTIELPAGDAVRLYRACAQMPGTGPGSADTDLIRESLSRACGGLAGGGQPALPARQDQDGRPRAGQR
jgi:hypothetical protein